jgi:sugar/nucleoside kinase (ribokinase family)
MLDFLIYGKIIIDDIRLGDGRIARNILGGGGPQAAFGARLWSDSVGFLSRSGSDLEAEHVHTLRQLDIDLAGWQQYPDIPTTRNLLLNYDENGYMIFEGGKPLEQALDRENWFRLLSQELTLPPTYLQPRAIHLITEFADEPMVQRALELQAKGAIFSLEPLLDFLDWSNRDQMLALLPQVDIATPDWPSASGIAGSDDPKQVMAYWSKLGPRMLAIRNGPFGSYTWDREHGQIWHIPALPVNVVDPTGAGNSYGGGLGVGWAETQDARLAGCYGAVSAKYLVERVGLPQMSTSLQAEARALLEQTLLATKEIF